MKKFLPTIILFLVSLLAFFPAFLGRIPLNARNLVSFFTPWYYEKFPGFPIGVPSKPGMLDQIRIYYPYMQLTQESYQRGELPLWNPYNFMGNPHMAEWQSGAFYPLHLLLPFLPLPVYWTLYQILGFFLAGLFTYLFLRNLKLGVWASLMGGTTYMLSSFMTTWNMEVVTAPHSILWLPLALLSIDKLVEFGVFEKSQISNLKSQTNSNFKTQNLKLGRWWCIGLASFVFSILSGYWQTTLYVMGVALVYAMYRTIFNRSLSTIHYPLSTLLWFPLALGLTAFHLLPTAELYQRSGRPILNASPEIQQILLSYLLPVRHLVTLIAPDYFGHPTTRNYFANVGGGTYYEHQLFVGTIQFFLALVAITFVTHHIFVRGSSAKKKQGGTSRGAPWPGSSFESETLRVDDPTWVAMGLTSDRTPGGKSPDQRLSDVLFWTILSIVAASFSFDTPWARWVFEVKLPVLSTGIANRIFFVNQFGMAVLAAFGLEFVKWREARGTMHVAILGIAIGLIVLAGITYQYRSSLGAYDPGMFPENYKTSLRNLVIPIGIFLIGSILLVIPTKATSDVAKAGIHLSSRPKSRDLYRFRIESGMTIVFSGILTISLLQNLYQHHKFTAFSEMQFVYPPHSTLTWLQQNAGFNRFLGYNGQYLNNNFATAYKIFAVDGYDSLNDLRRSTLIHSAIKGDITDLPPRSADATLSTDFWNPRTLRLMQLFGVKYLVDHPEWIDVLPSMERRRLPEEKEQLVFQDRDWRIFEYQDALPRAFLVGNYEVVEDGQPTIDRLYSDDFDPRNSVLLTPDSAKLLSSPVAPDPNSSAEIVSLTPNSMTLTINSLTDQLLFISDTWYPGWHAKLENGSQLPILTADYALRAVPVPAGEHTVKMYYFPESFRNGVFVSVTTLFLIGIFATVRKRAHLA